MKWCDFLEVPIKGIYSSNEVKPLHHSPCIINMDDFGSLGTHWVCCWPGKKGMEYFDSFGMPPPLEWEKEIAWLGHKNFLHNDNQIQAVRSVRCGYYCPLFLNERNRGVSFANLLKRFSPDVCSNEKVVKSYFLNIL